jgi:hypothetical protein
MLAIEMKYRLEELQAERLLALIDLAAEIAEAEHAYVAAAVTEIATLRAELFGPEFG